MTTPREQALIRRPHLRVPGLELTCILTGLLGRLVATSSEDFFGTIPWALGLTGWVALLVGIPLYFAPVRSFWWDFSYIIVGVIGVVYFWTRPAEPIMFLGYFAVASPGFLLAGVSFGVRRGIAFYLHQGAASDNRDR